MKIKTLTKSIVSVILALSMLASMTACFGSSSKNLYPNGGGDMGDIPTTPSESFDEAYADFSVELLARALTLTDGENIVVSPISLIAVLDMLAHGSDGETLAQFVEFFDMPLEEYSGSVASFLNALDGAHQASTANSLWIRNSFPVHQSYLNEVGRYFTPDIYTAPFDNTTLRDINGWADEKTDGLIPKILEEIDPSAVMYLMNAVLFDAKWQDKYEKSDIVERRFTNANGDSREVKMLYSTESKYYAGDGYVGFAKDYEGRDFSFVALLPDEGLTPEQLLSRLDGKLSNVLEDFTYESVLAYMPCFEAENSLDLGGVLKDMGLTDVFSSTADLTRLSDEEGLFLGLIRQNTYIELNENGTKAAAVTIGGVYCESADFVIEPKEVILDRPYVYMIVHNETGLPVFIGITNHAQ